MPGQSLGEGKGEVSGVEAHDGSERDTKEPEDQDNPDEGSSMSGAGAGPGGSAMDHWETSQPQTDATKPETMPKALGGTGEDPNPDEQSNPA